MPGARTAILVVEQSSAAVVSSCERLGRLGFKTSRFVSEAEDLTPHTCGSAEVILFGASCDLSTVLRTAKILKSNAISPFVPLITLREIYDLKNIAAAAAVGLYEFLIEPTIDAQICQTLRTAIRDATAAREVALLAATLGTEPPILEPVSDAEICEVSLDAPQRHSLSAALNDLGMPAVLTVNESAQLTNSAQFDVVCCHRGPVSEWTARLAGCFDELTARSPAEIALRLKFARIRPASRLQTCGALRHFHAVITPRLSEHPLLYDHANRQIGVNRALGHSNAAIGFRVSNLTALRELKRHVRAYDFIVAYDKETVCLFFSGLVREELDVISERLSGNRLTKESAYVFREFLQHDDRAASFLHGLLNKLRHAPPNEAEE
ncbi:MAG: hypothetical protein VX900_15750 [Pseudomonadota bacterium]|nr:hypothetical protein [Pseudomonadota bacterium]